MDIPKKKSSRKNFILWGAIAITSATVLKFFNNKKTNEEQKKVKMLAQDGTLVEIDLFHLNTQTSKKISDRELKKWVKKK